MSNSPSDVVRLSDQSEVVITRSGSALVGLTVRDGYAATYVEMSIEQVDALCEALAGASPVPYIPALPDVDVIHPMAVGTAAVRQSDLPPRDANIDEELLTGPLAIRAGDATLLLADFPSPAEFEAIIAHGQSLPRPARLPAIRHNEPETDQATTQIDDTTVDGQPPDEPPPPPAYRYMSPQDMAAAHRPGRHRRNGGYLPDNWYMRIVQPAGRVIARAVAAVRARLRPRPQTEPVGVTVRHLDPPERLALAPSWRKALSMPPGAGSWRWSL